MRKMKTEGSYEIWLLNENDYEKLDRQASCLCGKPAEYTFKLTGEAMCLSCMMSLKTINLPLDSELLFKARMLAPKRKFSQEVNVYQSRKQNKLLEGEELLQLATQGDEQAKLKLVEKYGVRKVAEMYKAWYVKKSNTQGE